MADVPRRQDRMGPQILRSTSLDQMWAENQEGHSPTQAHMVNYQEWRWDSALGSLPIEVCLPHSRHLPHLIF